MAKTPKSKQTIQFSILDPNSTPVEDLQEIRKTVEVEKSPLLKSILNVLDGQGQIERLAFEKDPTVNSEYAALYYSKLRLLPDHILKRIAIQDDLVASICTARSNQLAAFGRPQPDRFSTGFKIDPKPGVLDDLDEKKKAELQDRIEKARERMVTCGNTKGWSDHEKLTFSQFLYIQSRCAITVGRFATEVIYAMDKTGNKVFHSFRPIDAGTIYKAAPHTEHAQSVRDAALHMLETMKNKKMIPDKFQKDEYAWVQVIEGKPVQAFTPEECVVHNMYPVADVELGGYPLTPIDTMISAVTTHINITTHNKLYFQSGRATRGMIIIKSADVDPSTLTMIRQQFNASINSVNNAWRMPVFAVGPEEELTWQAIDSGQRDMEFQYLSDTNARVILSAFQMSPEELPGYAHLSRGTNNQALSEANNEYKLEAHRDVGIRPMIAQFQDFINAVLFPLIDENLAALCVVKLTGLDADTAEKESVRLQQDIPVHMTYDEVMEHVEKDPVGMEWGGEFPLNPQYQMVLDKYFSVGQIMEKFFGVKDAGKNPDLQYYRDPFWFQMQQLKQQAQQLQAQAQAAQQGEGGPPSGGGGGGESSGGESGPPAKESGGESEGGGEGGKEQESDLTTGIDQVINLLSKSEAQLPPSKRRLLAQHRKIVEDMLAGMEKDVQQSMKELLDVADKHAKKD
jgi:hypothetical protein